MDYAPDLGPVREVHLAGRHQSLTDSERVSTMYVTEIRDILAKHGRLNVDVATLADDGDLYQAGLTSLITVNLLLAIEDHFDLEFPDELLSRRTFQSIAALSEAVEDLVQE